MFYKKSTFHIKPIFLSLFFLLPISSHFCSAFDFFLFQKSISVVQDSKSEYVIVVAKDAIPSERFAAEELSNHLEKIFSCSFPIIQESSEKNELPAIYLGNTLFAQKNSFKLAEFTVEEWLLQTVDKNIILAGGRPRGTLYAVYEFLEKILDCQWFDYYNEHIPKRKDLKLSPFNIRAKAVFKDRHIYSGLTDSDKDQLLRLRNKDTRPKAAKYGYGYNIGTHTFWTYSRKFPEDKPEFLALNDAGERPVSKSGHGPGQICLTNPGARAAVLKDLKERIEVDLQKHKASKDGRELTYSFGITQNDSHWICKCPDCQAIKKAGNADSAVLLDFINYLAENIKEQYPDVLLETWAYANTTKAPENIKPADNVLIRVVQLNGEWAGDARRAGDPDWKEETFPDFFRAKRHRTNKAALEQFEQWAAISKHLGVWDYWVLYGEAFPTPYINLRALADNLKLYEKLGLERFFVENEIGPLSSFYTLKCWAGWKLMQDPQQNLNKLVDVFMPAYYGNAAKEMRNYYEFLEDSIAKVPASYNNMAGMKTSQRPYLTLNFFTKAKSFFDKIEMLSALDKTHSLNVIQEKVIVDIALYIMWEKFVLESNKNLPWDKDSLLQDIERKLGLLIDKRPEFSKLLGSASLQERIVDLQQKSEAFIYMDNPVPKLTVPYIEKVNANLEKVPWEKAAVINEWKTKFAQEIPERKLRAAMLHDGEFLYVLLEEYDLDTSLLSPVWWGGDGWELFLCNDPEKGSYRQMAFNSNGEHKVYSYDGGQKEYDPISAINNSKSQNSWKVEFAVPLDKLLQEKLQAGEKFYLNIFRQTRYRTGEHLCWSPIFEAGLHDLEKLGEITLEK